jgi:WD40 repeat protein
MNGSDQAVSLDGSLLVWDVNTGAVLARKEKYAPEIGGMPLSYMAVDVLPVGGGVGVGVGDSRSTGTQQQHQLLAATQTTLYHLDLRDRASASSTSMVLTQASEWGVSSSCFQDRGIGAALQCVCAHDDAHWICAGSSNGQLCVLDRRTGEIAQAWQAHEGPILRVFPWGRDKVLSVSLDQTAVLWDIRHTIPRDICCLRGLPDSQSGMTLLVHEFRRSSASATAPLISGLGVTGTKRPHVLMSFGGHKGVVARMPRPGMDVAAKARYFLSPNGLKLRAKINVQSAAMLPLRKLLLVGCDDGNIRVCT